MIYFLDVSQSDEETCRVTCPAFPEISFLASHEETSTIFIGARMELTEAIAARMKDAKAIPPPDRFIQPTASIGTLWVKLLARTLIRVGLYELLRRTQLINRGWR